MHSEQLECSKDQHNCQHLAEICTERGVVLVNSPGVIDENHQTGDIEHHADCHIVTGTQNDAGHDRDHNYADQVPFHLVVGQDQINGVQGRDENAQVRQVNKEIRSIGLVAHHLRGSSYANKCTTGMLFRGIVLRYKR